MPAAMRAGAGTDFLLFPSAPQQNKALPASDAVKEGQACAGELLLDHLHP